VDAKTLRAETSLLRRRLIRGFGLVLGMFMAFFVGGVPGMAAFFVFATVASIVTYAFGRRAGRG